MKKSVLFAAEGVELVDWLKLYLVAGAPKVITFFILLLQTILIIKACLINYGRGGKILTGFPWLLLLMIISIFLVVILGVYSHKKADVREDLLAS